MDVLSYCGNYVMGSYAARTEYTKRAAAALVVLCIGRHIYSDDVHAQDAMVVVACRKRMIFFVLCIKLVWQC